LGSFIGKKEWRRTGKRSSQLELDGFTGKLRFRIFTLLKRKSLKLIIFQVIRQL